jgi:hypothetical protein
MKEKGNKALLGVREIMEKMITTNLGTVSSKVIIGAISYMIITIAIVVVIFVNPSFPGLTEIVITHILTSGSLLGLTTVENIRNSVKKRKGLKKC